MGNRIFGCDDCLAVCPWNKFAARASETKLVARADLAMPQLADLVRLDDAAFRQMFAGSPVKRIGRVRFIRNVLIAIGNSGNRDLAKSASVMLDEADPVLRGAAVWALGRLVDTNSFAALRRLHIERESDSDVIDEWNVQQGERAV